MTIVKPNYRDPWLATGGDLIDEHNADRLRIAALELPHPSNAAAAGRYMWPISQHTSSLVTTLGNNVARVGFWRLRRSITIDRMGGEIGGVGEAGSKMRWLVYADNGNAYPGALVLDAGQIAADAVAVADAPTLGTPLVIPAGFYWVGGVVQGAPTTQPNVRSVSAWLPEVQMITANTIPGSAGTGVGYIMNGVTGAAPAQWTSSLSIAGAVPRPHMKITAVN